MPKFSGLRAGRTRPKNINTGLLVELHISRYSYDRKAQFHAPTCIHKFTTVRFGQFTKYSGKSLNIIELLL